jgi:hypothetical protein
VNGQSILNVLSDRASFLRQADYLARKKQTADMQRIVDLHARQLVGFAF